MHSQDDFSMVLWVKFFIPWLKRVCILVIISVSNASKCSRPLLGCWAWKAQFLVFTPDIRTLEHCCLSRAKWISEKPLQFLLLRLHFCLPDNGLGWVLNNVQWTGGFNRQHCRLNICVIYFGLQNLRRAGLSTIEGDFAFFQWPLYHEKPKQTISFFQ